MHGKHCQYESPLVRDYGDLREITASFRAIMGVTTTDLSFSGPGSQPGGGGVENRETGGPPPGGPPPGTSQQVLAGVDPQVTSGGPGAPDVSDGADAPGGADSPDADTDPGTGGGGTGGGGTAGGGTSGGGGAGDGGSLPFTGLAAGAIAAAGSALAAAGTALRRRTRRPPERDT